VVVYAAAAIPIGLFAPLLQYRLLPLLASALWLGYFVLLKWSRVGTLGYRVGSVRLINLRGDRPGLLAVALRACFMLLGPVNYLLDLVWLGGDDHRQALHDKFAQTYVVRSGASPVGDAPVRTIAYNFAAATLLFSEVRVPVERPTASAGQ
jgi:uncharacterized RDD family membrane protein YckC